ncbi:rano class II histocompatibility antigen, A beta chain-like isoform X2 [Elgaria multicarinata webbii]|uniref:rano class II histocompatibility antigen, A beta chain-like isoform X2 n=1 Tax=Elgaria multicarinata webbii TaxID=159646 RepID=UPI002FCD5C93
MGPALVLPLLLLLGPSLVPGSGGGKKPPPAPHFLLQVKWECRYSNGTGQPQVRFLAREVYGRRNFAHFDSDVGECVADAEWAEQDVQQWNRDKDHLRGWRAQVEVFCRHNYDNIFGPFSHRRRVQPSVSISPTKEDPLSPHTLLLCTAASFYPLEIEIQWLKNGQEQKEGVFYGEELRNGDWTYQTQVMLETKPEHGDVYTCQVEHASLEAPITIQWEPLRSDSARSKVWTGAVGAVLGVVFVAVGLSLYRKKKKATPIQPPAGKVSLCTSSPNSLRWFLSCLSKTICPKQLTDISK